MMGSRQDVVDQFTFYRQGYESLQRLVFLLSLALIGAIVVIIAMVFFWGPQDRFFATTGDGRIIPMTSLAMPNMSDAALLSWSSKAIVEANTFGHHDYRMRLEAARKYFTDKGFIEYQKSLTASRTFDRIIKEQQVVSVSPAGAPVLLKKENYKGTQAYLVEMPVNMTISAGSRKYIKAKVVTLLIVRVPTDERERGVAIKQWLESNAK